MSAAAAILQMFAALTTPHRDPVLDVASGDRPFAWLGLEQSLFAQAPANTGRLVLDDRPGLRALATLDSLHRHERLLREGWVFLVGSVDRDGERQDLFIPLVSRPVRLTRRTGGLVLTAAGDRELLSLVPTGPTRNRLAGLADGAPPPPPHPVDGPFPVPPAFGSVLDVASADWLHEWIRAVADAAGLHVDLIVRPESSPRDACGGDEVTAAVGSGIYVARDLRVVDLASTLAAWAVVPGIEETAFASTYGIRPTVAGRWQPRGPVRSVLPLTARQREVVVRSRGDDVTVVTGPPGNGKSHTVVAAAMDALERGSSVLIATHTDHAADVLADMLRRQPGPDPVLFGDAERRDDLAGQLDTGLGAPLSAQALARRSLGVDQLEARVHAIEQAIALDLAAEVGTESSWDELERADAELALGIGSLIADRMHAERAVTPPSRAAVAALVHSLRADRAWRRINLESLDGSSLLQALPLWIGTLRDIDDLLPPTPGLFDLVILDEAAQIDQPTAALALLRGDRAVIVGDPHQLRHEPTIDELEVATAASEHGLDVLRSRLDLANSAFDVAAAAAPVTWLDEHFRSAPHLIQFSAEHFYPHDLHLMTRHPRNEAVDVIDTYRVDGRRDDRGVNAAEVEAVRRLVRAAIERGLTNIGVVSPVAEQAAALEAMLLAELPRLQLAALDLQVGSVERFQGSERDLVLLSLAIDDRDVEAHRRALAAAGTDDPGTALDGDRDDVISRIEQPNTFNVMVSRARERLVLVTSVDESVGGLIGELLAYAEHAPEPAAPRRPRHPWVAALADELECLDVTTRPDYPVGQWTIDLCIGDGERALAVECVVHPAGPVVHVERHRALRRAGWRITDSFATRWDGDPVAAAVALATELRRDPRR